MQRLFITALACLISVSVFGQENPDTWIEITVTCNGESDSFSTLSLYDEYGGSIWSSNGIPNSWSNVREFNHAITGVAGFYARNLESGEYTIVFDVDVVNQIGGSITVNIQNACNDNLLNESFELNYQNTFSFYVPPCNHLTYVPDDNLESILESTFDFTSNGQPNDNYVNTIGLISPNDDYILINNNNEFGPIFNVTGLENLILKRSSNLIIEDTFISGDLDLSGYKFFGADLSIYGNQYLESVTLPNNYFIDDITINNNEDLIEINMSDDLTFGTLFVSGGVSSIGGITSIPCRTNISGFLHKEPYWSYQPVGVGISVASRVVDLTGLSFAPYLTGLSLTASYVDLRNNISIYNWDVGIMPPIVPSSEGPIDYETFQNGTCVNLNNQSDIDFCVNNNGWPNDLTTYGYPEVEINYALDCNIENFDCSNINSVNSLNISKEKKLDKVVDALGREVNQTTNQILFYIYDDGSVEKKFIVE